jgi:hypothetical protein
MNRSGQMQKEEEIRRRVKVLRRFYMDVINFAVINAILILIWLTFDKTGTFWPKYVILIWGILLVFKASRMGTISLIFPRTSFLSHDWEEKKVRELIRKQNRHPKPLPPKKGKEK